MINTIESLSFRLAAASDADSILSLYRSLTVCPGCAWDDFYPARENVEDDIRRHALFMAEIDGKLAGAAAYDYDPEPLAFFDNSFPLGTAAEICRVGVRRDLQGQGIARAMAAHILKKIADSCDTAYLLVSPNNHSAVRLYQSLGFEHHGEGQLYDIFWHLYTLRFLDRRRPNIKQP